MHAPEVAPCGAIAWGYSCTSVAEYGAVHLPLFIPSVVGAGSLVTLTEVNSRLDDLQTACTGVKHSGYIV